MFAGYSPNNYLKPIIVAAPALPQITGLFDSNEAQVSHKKGI
jgi:hypothetical protein